MNYKHFHQFWYYFDIEYYLFLKNLILNDYYLLIQYFEINSPESVIFQVNQIIFLKQLLADRNI